MHMAQVIPTADSQLRMTLNTSFDSTNSCLYITRSPGYCSFLSQCFARPTQSLLCLSTMCHRAKMYQRVRKANTKSTMPFNYKPSREDVPAPPDTMRAPLDVERAGVPELTINDGALICVNKGVVSDNCPGPLQATKKCA
jgi:hypothetical protein